MRILAVVPEAYGGFGGISVYNVDLLNALAKVPTVRSIDILPRLVRQAPGVIPSKARLIEAAAASRTRFAFETARVSLASYDLILCTHIHLLPFAALLRTLKKRHTPLLCVIYGIDAWQKTDRRLANRLVASCDGFISISDFTTERFVAWSKVEPSRIHLLANCVHADHYGLGPKPQYLLQRYGLRADDPVVMTFGRLASIERQKGVDELLSSMPRLLRVVPNLKCMVAGDGDDRLRLEQKTDALGIRSAVRFAGRISEDEKADHYRLADTFSLVGRQEGFGFVLIEALACGIPVVASVRDGSREAILGGELGELADPDDPASISSAILSSLEKPKQIPERLEHFSFENFVDRVDGIVGRYALKLGPGRRA